VAHPREACDRPQEIWRGVLGDRGLGRGWVAGSEPRKSDLAFIGWRIRVIRVLIHWMSYFHTSKSLRHDKKSNVCNTNSRECTADKRASTGARRIRLKPLLLFDFIDPIEFFIGLGEVDDALDQADY
jgi:hypothetical protein